MTSFASLKKVIQSLISKIKTKKEEGYFLNKCKSGVWKEWYENGQIKKKAHYEKGKGIGESKEWYANGQIKEIGTYVPNRNAENTSIYKMKEYWSESGELWVTEGSGDVTYYHSDTTLISSKGSFKDGIKSGRWKGYNMDGQLIYDETYQHSKVKGTSWDEQGNQYEYEELEIEPAPKKG
ncbi:MAG: hypothetical protein JXR07_06410 [Reichenbachiella sp.]